MTVSITAKSRTISNGQSGDAAPVEQNFVELYNNDGALKTAVEALQGGSIPDATNLVINSAYVGSSPGNMGVFFERGTLANTGIRWNETKAYLEYTLDGTNYHPIPAVLASDPVSPVEGDIWYNTTLHALRVRLASSTISVANFTTISTILSRSSNTVLAVADNGAVVVCTSTFTQTFTAAATLGANWYCFIRNDGTGAITLDPNASETIDSVTTLVVYPGEAFMVLCDGAAFKTVGRQRGGWIRLGSATASSSATVDFTSFITSDFDEYVLTGQYVLPATDGVDAWIRFSTDGGSSFMASTQYSYINAGTDVTSSSGSGGAQIKLNRVSIGNADGEGLDFEIRFTKPSGGQALKGMRWFSNERNTSSGIENHFGGATTATASAINAIRFLFSSGNIAQGSLKLYGVRG